MAASFRPGSASRPFICITLLAAMLHGCPGDDDDTGDDDATGDDDSADDDDTTDDDLPADIYGLDGLDAELP
jgi:hypothetical protein